MSISVVTLKTGDRVITELKEIFDEDGDNKKGIVDHIFEYNLIYHPNLHVIEETTMSRPIFQSLMSEMRRRNNFKIKRN